MILCMDVFCVCFVVVGCWLLLLCCLLCGDVGYDGLDLCCDCVVELLCNCLCCVCCVLLLVLLVLLCGCC